MIKMNLNLVLLVSGILFCHAVEGVDLGSYVPDLINQVYAAASDLNIDLNTQGINVTSTGPPKQQEGFCTKCNQQAGCKDVLAVPVPLVSGALLLSPLWEIKSSNTCITRQLDGACNTFICIRPNMCLLFRALTFKTGKTEIQTFWEMDKGNGSLGHFQLHGVSLNESTPHNKIISENLIALPVECLAAGTACLVLQRCSYYGYCCDIDNYEDEVFGVCSTPYVNSTLCKDALTKTGLGGPTFVELPLKLKTKCVCSFGNRDVANRDRIDDENCIHLPEGYADTAFN